MNIFLVIVLATFLNSVGGVGKCLVYCTFIIEIKRIASYIEIIRTPKRAGRFENGDVTEDRLNH